MSLVKNEYDVEVFRTWLRRQRILAIDTETNITENDHERFLVGVSFYAPGDEPWYIPFGHEHPFLPVENVPLWDFSKGIHKDATLIFHNAKFDLKVLRRAGIDLMPWDFVDTMLWSHMLDSHHPPQGIGHKLESLEVHLLKKDTKKDLVKKIRRIRFDYGMEAVPPFVMATYASNDVVSTYQLYELFLPRMEEWLLLPLWNEVDLPFTRLLVEIEEVGLRMDRHAAQHLAELAKDRMDQICQLLPFEPSKDRQTIDRFYSEQPIGLGLSPSKLTRGGRPSVDEATLAGINHPEAGLVLEYRGLAKQRSTYFLGYLSRCDENGYLHPTFKQHGTVTHRLSAENPNLQQVPREGQVKGLFMPDEGCDLIEFDYKTIEFRLGSVYADQQDLLKVFRTDGDLHQEVADRLSISRPVAKNVNFTILYGGGVEVLVQKYGVNRREAQRILTDYKSLYPELFAFAKRCQDLAEQRGWIRYWDGRLRVFKDKYECKDAFNSLIQGGAFQIIKKSMLDLHEEGIDIRNQVHDAIWVNVPKGYDLSIIEKIMVGWTEPKFGIPFPVESKVLHA